MKSIIAWFIENKIAANLLMIIIIFGGISSISTIDREFFPERELNLIVVTMIYPGAGPIEIEEQICRRIEEVLEGIDGIEEIRSMAIEGFGEVRISVEQGYEVIQVLNEVKSRVDAITSFPTQAERPRISEVAWVSRVITVGVAGDINPASLKELTLRIQDELQALSAVDKVTLKPERKYEVAIEVSESALRRYGLSFSHVADAIRGKSINLPAGKLRDNNGDVQLQVRGQAYDEQDFNDIVVFSNPDGGQILLRDVAEIIDGFEETDVISRLNGVPSLTLEVATTSKPDITQLSRQVRAYVERQSSSLPPGVTIKTWGDMNNSFEGRLRTLFSNGLGGLALVFVLLFLFLRPLLAMWVAVGIVIAFLGAVWLLPATDVSFNIISLFAFILILGIVIDDAIIVGESIYTHQQMDSSRENIVNGVMAVAGPVVMGVVTTMIIFGAFLFMSDDSPEPVSLGTVVLLALFFSLIESLFILPCHLAHMPPERPARGLMIPLAKLRGQADRFMQGLIQRYYLPTLKLTLARPGLTLLCFLVIWLLPFSYYAGGWMRSSFFPQVSGSFLVAQVKMPESTPFEEMRRLVGHIETQVERLREDMPKFIGLVDSRVEANELNVLMTIDNFEQMEISNRALKDRWQSYIGAIPGAKDFTISETIFSRGKPISLLVKAPTLEALRDASELLRDKLATFPQVFNISSDLDAPRTEIGLSLKQQAENLGVALADIAREVRRGFYGEEAQRIPRAREDVRVLVRYPKEERSRVDSLIDMRVRTATGREVPLEEIADIEYTEGYRRIDRLDGQRTTVVSAETSFGVPPQSIIQPLLALTLPVLKARHPDLTIELYGAEEDNQEFQTTLRNLMITVLLIIYGLIAVIFRSWLQPLLIISAVPFGLVGAILGHVLIGREISMFSLLGMFAAIGVVINDNLVLVHRINQLRARGFELGKALVQGARDRFRAIVLTSLTTFIGLMPIMFQRSVQAQFLVPMVVSLAFGVLFASVVTLYFAPNLYAFGSALGARFSRRASSSESKIGLSQSSNNS